MGCVCEWGNWPVKPWSVTKLAQIERHSDRDSTYCHQMTYMPSSSFFDNACLFPGRFQLSFGTYCNDSSYGSDPHSPSNFPMVERTLTASLILIAAQEQRRILQTFTANRVNILVATSVGSEGMDFRQCKLVVAFDLPVSRKANNLWSQFRITACINFKPTYTLLSWGSEFKSWIHRWWISWSYTMPLSNVHDRIYTVMKAYIYAFVYIYIYNSEFKKSSKPRSSKCMLLNSSVCFALPSGDVSFSTYTVGYSVLGAFAQSRSNPLFVCCAAAISIVLHQGKRSSAIVRVLEYQWPIITHIHVPDAT